MSQNDPGREAILRGNEQRLNAYDEWRAERDDLIAEIGELRHQNEGLLSNNHKLVAQFGEQQILIDDLQKRERTYQLAAELHLIERESIVANLVMAISAGEGTVETMKKALENFQKAVSNEIADKRRSITEQEGRVAASAGPVSKALQRMEEELGQTLRDEISPSITPEAPQEEQPQRLAPRRPMQPASAYPQQRFRPEDGDQQ